MPAVSVSYPRGKRGCKCKAPRSMAVWRSYIPEVSASRATPLRVCRELRWAWLLQLTVAGECRVASVTACEGSIRSVAAQRPADPPTWARTRALDLRINACWVAIDHRHHANVRVVHRCSTGTLRRRAPSQRSLARRAFPSLARPPSLTVRARPSAALSPGTLGIVNPFPCPRHSTAPFTV